MRRRRARTMRRSQPLRFVPALTSGERRPARVEQLLDPMKTVVPWSMERVAGRQTEVIVATQTNSFHRRPLATLRTFPLQQRRQRCEECLHLQSELGVVAEPATRVLGTRQRSSDAAAVLLQLLESGHDARAALRSRPWTHTRGAAFCNQVKLIKDVKDLVRPDEPKVVL